MPPPPPPAAPPRARDLSVLRSSYRSFRVRRAARINCRFTSVTVRYGFLAHLGNAETAVFIGPLSRCTRTFVHSPGPETFLIAGLFAGAITPRPRRIVNPGFGRCGDRRRNWRRGHGVEANVLIEEKRKFFFFKYYYYDAS